MYSPFLIFININLIFLQIADILKKLRVLLVDAGNLIINKSTNSRPSSTSVSPRRSLVRFTLSTPHTTERYTSSSSAERKSGKGSLSPASAGSVEKGVEGVWGPSTAEINRYVLLIKFLMTCSLSILSLNDLPNLI